MRVRLLHKFAERIDGVDLTNHRVGEVADLPSEHAHLLIAEGWAVATLNAVASDPEGSDQSREDLERAS